MIKPGDVIKHKAFRDVAIFVTFSLVNPETGDLELKGIWLNQGVLKSYILNTKKYPLGIPFECSLKKYQVQNWLKCNKFQELDCLRDGEWSELG